MPYDIIQRQAYGFIDAPHETNTKEIIAAKREYMNDVIMAIREYHSSFNGFDPFDSRWKTERPKAIDQLRKNIATAQDMYTALVSNYK